MNGIHEFLIKMKHKKNSICSSFRIIKIPMYFVLNMLYIVEILPWLNEKFVETFFIKLFFRQNINTRDSANRNNFNYWSLYIIFI